MPSFKHCERRRDNISSEYNSCFLISNRPLIQKYVSYGCQRQTAINLRERIACDSRASLRFILYAASYRDDLSRAAGSRASSHELYTPNQAHRSRLSRKSSGDVELALEIASNEIQSTP